MRLIDADALTEKLGISEKCDCCQYNSMDNCEKELYFAEACCEIYNAPTVVTHPKWIPCSVRLPDKKQYVFVTINYFELDVVMDIWDGDMFMYYGENVVAWMPLPEPYKGE